MKTNALRRLDELGVPYETREYTVDPDDLSAETVAGKIGMPVEQVFKTLVVRADSGAVLMAVIPGNAELNLKALAKSIGERNVELVPLKDVQLLTGYVRGGVTALAAKKDYPVFVDETMVLYPQVAVSAGTRGLQMLLDPDNYLRATKATLGDFTKPKLPG